VVSAGNDRRLILWDVGSGRAIRTFEGHADDVTAASWLLDGRYLVSGSADCMVKVWAVADGRCLATLDGHTSAVLSVCISPDGRYVLSGGADKKARLWFLDWELEDRDTADWDERARQHLVNFLSLHTPCVGSPTEGGTPTDEEVRLALMRQGQPIWTDADFTQLLRTLGCAGYGWLRPEGVKRELEKMAADWQGPPPLPWESA
jgi:WD40 repeat protein